jgi:polysaccharide biosynthesis transport protein
MSRHSSNGNPAHRSRRTVGNGRNAPRHDQPGEALAVETVYAREIFSILRRRAWIVLGAPALALAVALFILHRQEPMYRASALILIKDYRREVAGGIEDAINERPVGRFSDALLSQIELLRSRAVVGDAVDREGLRVVSLSRELPISSLVDLAVSPDAPDDTLHLVFRADAFEVRTSAGRSVQPYGARVATGGLAFSVLAAPPAASAQLAVIPRERAIDLLAAAIQARTRPQTDAVEVSFTGPDPIRAQSVANALVQTFHESSMRAAQQRSQRRRTFLEAQLQGTDSLLAEAQVTLSMFRSREVVYSSREKLTAQQQGLMSLEIRRAELDADYQMYRSLLSGLDEAAESERNTALRTLVSSPEVASNAVVSRLYELLAQYEAERAALTRGPNASTVHNPDVIRLSDLIASTESSLLDAVRSHVAALHARINALDGLRLQGAAEIRQLPQREAEEVRLVQRVETYRRLADQLGEDLQKARIAEAVEAGQVEIVHLAPVPAAPVRGGRRKLFGLALALGIFVGVSGGFGVEVMNSSIRRREEIEALLRIPQLGVIPALRANGIVGRVVGPLHGLRSRYSANGSHKQQSTTIASPGAAGNSAYRLLRTNVVLTRDSKPLHSIAVTSAGAGEGKTTTAANLAIAFAQSGRRVLLVDCDVQSPGLHRVFDLPRAPGLAEMIREGTAAAETGFATHVPGLTLLPAGEYPSDPAELLTSDRAHSALQDLAARYDLLVLDTPPILESAETVALAALVDEVILVVRAGWTKREIAQQALRQLQLVGADVAGAVLNDPDHAETYGPYAAK